MPEQLARAEQVQHPPVMDDLDRPGADHPQVFHRPGTLREDRLSGGIGLDLSHRRDARNVVRPYRIEGRVGAEEVREVLHRAGT